MENGSDHTSSWLKGAVWVMAIGLPVASVWLGIIRDADRAALVDRDEQRDLRIEFNADQTAILDAIVRGLAVSVGELDQQLKAHDEQCTYWKGVADANRTKIADLQTSTAARPDPFTGSDGIALERRIHALERGMDALADRVKKRHEQE